MTNRNQAPHSRAAPFVMLLVITMLSLTGDVIGQDASQVPRLLTQLKDKDDSVRESAALALGRIGAEAKRAVPQLSAALKDQNRDVRQAAAEALASIAPEATEAVQPLIGALKDSDDDVRRAAADALKEIGEGAKEAVVPLINALKDKSADVRRTAADALKQIKAEPTLAVAPLIQALNDEQADVRKAAASALGSIEGETSEAVGPLVHALTDQDKSVRQAAAESLGDMGPKAKAAVQDLTKALKDDDASVRWTAAGAFMRIGTDDQEAVSLLIASLKDDNGYVRRFAADALGRIAVDSKEAHQALLAGLDDKADYVRRAAATALSTRAESLQDLKATEWIDELNRVRERLVSDSDPQVQKHSETVRRAIDYLSLIQKDSLKEQVLQMIRAHKYVALTIAGYAFLLLLWLGFLWRRPIWLLRINVAVKPYTDFKLPDWLGGMKVPLSYVVLVGFFHYRLRVLDAWVDNHMNSVREKFSNLETVRNREVHLAVPVMLDRAASSSFSVEQLRHTFAERRAYLLVWGEGGSGKSSLACQIAKWCMSSDNAQRPCKHSMLPVLIEQELDFEVASNKQHFTEAIRGQLQALIGEAEPVSEELLDRLLRHRRILVILDHFSEMSETTRKKIRPAAAEFPVNALIVTSRIDEPFDGVPKTTVKTLRIQGNRLSSFMDDYLKARGKRELFEDVGYFEGCRRLSMMVGDRDITVLLAKLYAEQMIATKEETLVGDLPENIPDLMLSYLNELNREARERDPDDRTIHRVAKAIAWECLKVTYRPSAAKLDDVLAAVSGEVESEALLSYLEERLKLIQPVQPRQDRIRFALDPLAEYLAALHLVETYEGNEELWRDFLSRATAIPGSPEGTKEFLLAVRDCCLARSGEVGVPDFVPEELGKLAGLDLGAVRRAQLEQRIMRLLSNLKVPEADDRRTAISALASLKQKAKMAVSDLSRILQEDIDWQARMDAAFALGEIGPQAHSAVPVLIHAMMNKSQNPNVRRNAAGALGEIGPGAKLAVPDLIEVLKDRQQDTYVRVAATKALGRIKAQASDVIPILTEALRDNENSIRRGAASALEQFGSNAKTAIPSLIEALNSDEDVSVREQVGSALGAIGSEADQVVPALIGALDDPNRGVRESMAKALGRFGPAASSAVPFLIGCIRDVSGGQEDRANAIRALGEIGPEARAAIPDLMGLLRSEDRDSHKRSIAVVALGKIGHDADVVISYLIELLKDHNENSLLRGTAARVLGAMRAESTDVAAMLVGSLGDEERPVRFGAAEGLAVMGCEPEAAIPVLIDVLSGENSYDRGGAALAIGKFGSKGKAAIPALIHALNDPEDSTLHIFASMSLAEMGPAAESAVPALIEVLKDEDRSSDALIALIKIGPPAVPALIDTLKHDPSPEVRGMSAMILGNIGPETEDAITALNAALQQPSVRVREAAESALKHITRRRGSESTGQDDSQ